MNCDEQQLACKQCALALFVAVQKEEEEEEAGVMARRWSGGDDDGDEEGAKLKEREGNRIICRQVAAKQKAAC